MEGGGGSKIHPRCFKGSLTRRGVCGRGGGGEGGGGGGKRWVAAKERSGSWLSTQSHHRQGYRPDTVSTLCPEHPHKSPDRQTQQSTSTLFPPSRGPQGSLGMSLRPHRLLLGAQATTDYSGCRLTRICHVDLKTTCSGCEYIMKQGGTGCLLRCSLWVCCTFGCRADWGGAASGRGIETKQLTVASVST